MSDVEMDVEDWKGIEPQEDGTVDAESSKSKAKQRKKKKPKTIVKGEVTPAFPKIEEIKFDGLSFPVQIFFGLFMLTSYGIWETPQMISSQNGKGYLFVQ